MAEREDVLKLGRRTFIRAAGGAGLGFVLYTRLPGGVTEAVAAIPGGDLDPSEIPKYLTPLLIPPVMPRGAVIRRTGAGNVDYYEISMRQFEQQILPAGLPATTVWGYGAVARESTKAGPLVHNAPSLTIEAKWNRPVRVKWINELTDGNGDYLRHLLPVDPTLHWANPPGGTGGRDSQPSFGTTPGPYPGPVPMITHLHGAVGVGDESDGYAEAWYLPDAGKVPAGHATEGTWYHYFEAKAKEDFGAEWGPGFAVFQYPNPDRARTEWFHDHTLGMTRVNVYAGPAGFYLIRGGPGDAVVDSRTGLRATLPGPAPKAGDGPHKTYYEIPVALQDRAFNADGSLFYPDTRAFFDEYEGPYIPETDVAPIWNPEFFGNAIIANGNTWPFQTVEQRRYRFRMLNGCQSRFLILDFNQIPGVTTWIIGNEGGFLPAPVDLTATNGNRLLLGLAERADLIVDFTDVPVGSYVLANVGPDEPFGGGEPEDAFEVADPGTTGQVLQFRVVPASAPDPTTPPRFLVLPTITPLGAETRIRSLALIEMMSAYHDGPAQAVLGTVDADGMPQREMWADPVTQEPDVGDTELWEFHNFTADAHPMHIHAVAFEVVNRQALVTNEDGETEPPARLLGDPRPPEAWETGVKDTVTAYPGEVTRVRATFDTPGQFVWHCHIVEHEDHEMMRPFRIGPEQPGQPMGHGQE